MLITFFILITAMMLITALVLTRTWAIEREGVDIERQSFDLKDLNRFNSRQRTILILLAVPAAAFLLGFMLYALATIVVTITGVG